MRRLLTIIIVLGVAQEAAAQTGCFTAANWYDVFQVRKSFDGAAEEQDAGSVGLVSPGKESKTYFLLDAGVRTKPCEFNPWKKTATNNPPLIIWYPSIEWHHMSAEPLQEQEATNKGGGGLNGEVWFGDPATTAPRPYLVLKGTLKRNLISDTTEKNASILLSVAQFARTGVQGGFRPGSPIVYNNFRRAMYFPYVGYEYFRSLAITGAEDAVLAPEYDGGVAVGRVAFEFYPFHQQVLPRDIRFVIGGEYSYRRLLKDIPELETRDAHFLSLATTYFFDADQNIGIGLTVDRGRSPTTNFVDQQRVVLGLEVKR